MMRRRRMNLVQDGVEPMGVMVEEEEIVSSVSWLHGVGDP